MYKLVMLVKAKIRRRKLRNGINWWRGSQQIWEGAN